MPEFTGVYLPFQRGYEKVTGIIPAPGIISGPGTEIGGRPLSGGNAPPIALDDRLATDEDTALIITVLENDIELDGNDFLHVISASVSSSLGAALTVTATNITYNPAISATIQSLPEGSNRVDSFTYSLIDCCNPVTGTNWPTATGGRYTATNFITVIGVNDAPTPHLDSVATNPRLRTFENRVLEINAVTDLLPNDTDPDTDDNNTTLEMASVHSSSTHEDTFVAVSQLGALVTLELRFNRNETRIIYDPTGSATLNALSQGEVTNDVFYYSLIDSHGSIGMAEVRIQVTGTNDLPTANADALATDEDTEISIPATLLLANDTDPDTDDNRTTLTTLHITALNGAVSLVSTSSFGARIRVVGANLFYTPTVSSNLNALSRKEVVVDDFTYTASDNFGGSSTTTVLVTVTGVNDKPVSAPDSGVVNEDTLAIFPAPGVLANDREFDINGMPPDDRLRVLAATNVHTAQGATFSINADGSFSFDPRGTFDYLKENQTTNDGFSYTVVDDSYTIANDDEFSVAANAVSAVLPVLANDVTLTGTGGRLRVASLGLPDNGGVVVLGASSNTVVYTPQINSDGVETFQYAIEDGQGGHDTATVRVKVTLPIRNGNLVANADRFTVARGTAPILDVLANDNIVPAGGDVLTITAAGPPDHGGTVSITGPGPNNAIRFTPNTNSLVFPYTESFPYTVSGGGVALATGVVMVTVVNRQGILPVNDDVFTVIAGASSSSLDVLANDRIVPGTTTNLVITGLDTSGVSGLVSINTNATRLLYTPPVGSTSHVEPVFHYFISDGSGGTATGEVMVSVMQMGLNANDDFCTVARNSTNTLLVLANDNALPNVGQNLLITTIGLSNNAPNHGGLASVSPNGKSLIYTPSPTNLTGEETFAYEITDGTLARAQGRVKVQILDRQGVVNVNPDTFSVVRDSTNNLLRVLRNDNILPDTRERLTLIAVGVPSRGGAARIVGSAPNQSVLYSPPLGFVGDEDFTYSVADNRGGTALTTVRVHVGHLIAPDDLFTALSESQDNLLDVLANDKLLPDVTPVRPILTVGSPDHGGTVHPNTARDALLYAPAAGFRGLESFSYQVADNSGGIVTARATVRVLPAGGDRSTTSVAITVIGVNDAPTITGTTGGLGITDKEIIRPFLGVTIADVDEYGLQPLTVIVKLDDAVKGKLRNAGGFVESPAGIYTFHGTGPAATTSIRKLVFDPTDNRITVPATEITRFTICVADGYVPTPVIDDATTVAVIATNDPPIISGTVAQQTVYHRVPIRLFSSVVITEVDDLNAQKLVVWVTIDNPTHGFLGSIGAFVDQGGGVYQLGTAGAGVTAAAATETLRGMQFVPTTGGRVQPGQPPETTGFTISVEDGFDPAVVDSTTSVVAIHEFVNKLLASDGIGNDSFGLSVAVNNDVVVVGAPQADPRGNGSGAVYVYLPTNNPSLHWVQVQKIVPADGAAGDEFGTSVAVQNGTLVIGARAARGTQISGAVYVYSRGAGGVWTQTKKILPADGANNDEFGYSVSLDADTLAVGSRLDDDHGTSSGSAYLFGRHQGGTNNWGLLKKVVPADGAAGEEFGRAVSVHGDSLAVGATFDPPPGSAYLFGRNTGGANNWGQIRKLLPSDGLSGDDFGCSLSLGPDTLVVGARRQDQLGNDTGAAYVFARDQGGADNWGQLRKLVSPDSLNNDQFGNSVSLSRDKIVVGMPLAGVDNQSKFGAAYAFARNQGGTNNWGLLQKFERSDPGNNDQFGFAVAVGQDTVVVGVNMDDDLGVDSGSAYVYRLKYNNRPQLGAPIPNQLTTVGASFNFAIPPGAFGEPDVNDSFTITAAFGGSGPVPAWLSFNPATATFAGVPNAAGIHTILVTATDEDGTSVTTSFDIVVLSGAAGAVTSVEQWRLEHFGAAAVNNPALEASVWGDVADPDHDGLTNREEYYFGLDPTRPFGGADTVLSISRGIIPSRVILYYPRRTNDSRLSYCLEASIDLIHWSDTGPLVEGESVVALDGGLEFVRLELSVLPGPDTHQFFRIKVMP
ncbi:MAG TPA: Ig-like domain-containing protein [Verrucomicrobiae bacterium]|nr:Ig-like domain-containing protein [Verrucomicrobiae bacterium]